MPTRGKPLTVLAATVALAVLGVAAWRGWPHLRFWWLFEPLGKNAQGYPEYRHRQTGIVMVRIPGGTFWMGAQKEDPDGQNYDPEALPDEGTVHEVALGPLLIGKHEVTQEEWGRAGQANASKFRGSRRPVDGLSWDDCRAFCRATALQLPTEAQWEYACRGGRAGPCAGGGLLEDAAWYGGRQGTHPVGEKAANGFGLHDTLGNVWEWCGDTCGVSGPGRVMRGGSWLQTAEYCRPGGRFAGHRSERRSQTGYLGFRPAYPFP